MWEDSLQRSPVPLLVCTLTQFSRLFTSVTYRYLAGAVSRGLVWKKRLKMQQFSAGDGRVQNEQGEERSSLGVCSVLHPSSLEIKTVVLS